MSDYNDQQAPNINQWTHQFTLLTHFYAETHPSLAEQVTASHRTWKAYQEDIPLGKINV